MALSDDIKKMLAERKKLEQHKASQATQTEQKIDSICKVIYQAMNSLNDAGITTNVNRLGALATTTVLHEEIYLEVEGYKITLKTQPFVQEISKNPAVDLVKLVDQAISSGMHRSLDLPF